MPIYNLLKDSNIGSDQSAAPTVFASGVSPDSIPWSTAEDIIRDIVREGPFDAGATPMETEDSPLISTAMPGCPYRMTSYTGTALVDADATYGLQLHHPRFLEFIGAPDSARLLNHSPSFWVNRWVRNVLWRQQSTCREMRSHDVESSNSGTIRNVVASDVVGNVEYWC